MVAFYKFFHGIGKFSDGSTNDPLLDCSTVIVTMIDLSLQHMPTMYLKLLSHGFKDGDKQVWVFSASSTSGGLGQIGTAS